MREVRKLLKADPSLTHKQLAEQTGLAPATVGRWLRGKGKPRAHKVTAKTALHKDGDFQQLVDNFNAAKSALLEYLGV